MLVASNTSVDWMTDANRSAQKNGLVLLKVDPTIQGLSGRLKASPCRRALVPAHHTRVSNVARLRDVFSAFTISSMPSGDLLLRPVNRAVDDTPLTSESLTTVAETLMPDRFTGGVLAELGKNGGSRQSAATDDSWESALTAGKSDGAVPAELTAAMEKLRATIQLAEGTRARLFRPIRGPRRIRFPERAQGDMAARILLSRDGRTAYARRLNQVDLTDLVLCHPMREFSRRHGQTNKPVAFFSRTVGDLIACESQHERRFAILADWHEDVVHIAAQPFTIDFPPGHELDSHTPDFALIGASGAVVLVDVKWPAHAVDAAVLRRHASIRRTLAEAGMQHAMWATAAPTVTENIANFAAARAPEGIVRELGPKLIAAHQPGMRVEMLLETVHERHRILPATTLVVLRRLLWDHQLVVDMFAPFTTTTELWRP